LNDENKNVDVSRELSEGYLFRLPRAYFYADYIWPGLLMSPERLDKLRDFQFRPSDILICSYPKSGTTWVSEIVSLIVHRGDIEAVKRKPLHERVPWLEMDNEYFWVRFYWVWQLFGRLLGIGNAEENEKVGTSDEIPRVIFTHLPLELLPKQALEGRCKIIYVARNPKDNAVSFYHFHQMARFLGQQKITWNEFFPLYAVGKIYCGSWFEHVLGFWEFSKVNSNVLFLKYEDMKKDLVSEVKRIGNFVGLDLSEETRGQIVRHCQFETMKDNKMANRDGLWLFNQKVSKFMRKGMVGDWKNYFSVTQSEMFDGIYAERMKGRDLSFQFELSTED